MPYNAQKKDIRYVLKIETFVECLIYIADGVIQADKNDVLRARVCLCCLPSLMLGFYFTYLFLGEYFFHADINPVFFVLYYLFQGV